MAHWEAVAPWGEEMRKKFYFNVLHSLVQVQLLVKQLIQCSQNVVGRSLVGFAGM